MHRWPGMTPTTVLDLEHRTWSFMALSVDQYVEDTRRLREQAERRTRSRGG
jgi:hypothetical protein